MKNIEFLFSLVLPGKATTVSTTKQKTRFPTTEPTFYVPTSKRNDKKRTLYLHYNRANVSTVQVKTPSKSVSTRMGDKTLLITATDSTIRLSSAKTKSTIAMSTDRTDNTRTIISTVFQLTKFRENENQSISTSFPVVNQHITTKNETKTLTPAGSNASVSSLDISTHALMTNTSKHIIISNTTLSTLFNLSKLSTFSRFEILTKPNTFVSSHSSYSSSGHSENDHGTISVLFIVCLHLACKKVNVVYVCGN